MYVYIAVDFVLLPSDATRKREILLNSVHGFIF